uniref:(northern house mosquito) hypothetical protein n=1 Tax=Culex pipiens TaxID=7175 RepID=A0A8D8BHG2_CULPI
MLTISHRKPHTQTKRLGFFFVDTGNRQTYSRYENPPHFHPIIRKFPPPSSVTIYKFAETLSGRFYDLLKREPPTQTHTQPHSLHTFTLTHVRNDVREEEKKKTKKTN